MSEMKGFPGQCLLAVSAERKPTGQDVSGAAASRAQAAGTGGHTPLRSLPWAQRRLLKVLDSEGS